MKNTMYRNQMSTCGACAPCASTGFSCAHSACMQAANIALILDTIILVSIFAILVSQIALISLLAIISIMILKNTTIPKDRQRCFA
jgi:hypothetical protein